jgi:hypothetical protein
VPLSPPRLLLRQDEVICLLETDCAVGALPPRSFNHRIRCSDPGTRLSYTPMT